MRIVILEISTSHEECIYSQVKFLVDSGNSVDLILHKTLQNQIKQYEFLCNQILFLNPLEKSFFHKLSQQRHLLKVIKSYDLIIFNTASSSKIVRNLAFILFFSKVRCVGILHNSKKIYSSFTQKIISLKIKKYFVLNDDILKNTPKKSGICLESFYPIFFPYYTNTVKKPNKMKWIAIPGRIDWGRRDYRTLLLALLESKTLANIQFLILGKFDKKSEAGEKLWKLIVAYRLEAYFITFNEFVSNETYHSYLKASDFIMPLLKTESSYLQNKISGSFNLAFAYKKTLLSKVYFKGLEDLNENAVFFEINGLIEVLLKIDNGESVLEGNSYNDEKWEYDFQKRKYLKFIS